MQRALPQRGMEHNEQVPLAYKWRRASARLFRVEAIFHLRSRTPSEGRSMGLHLNSFGSPVVAEE